MIVQRTWKKVYLPKLNYFLDTNTLQILWQIKNLVCQTNKKTVATHF